MILIQNVLHKKIQLTRVKSNLCGKWWALRLVPFSELWFDINHNSLCAVSRWPLQKPQIIFEPWLSTDHTPHGTMCCVKEPEKNMAQKK